MLKINLIIGIMCVFTAAVSADDFFKGLKGQIRIYCAVDNDAPLRKTLLKLNKEGSDVVVKLKKCTSAEALAALQKGEAEIAIVNRKPSYVLRQTNQWKADPYAAAALVVAVNRYNKLDAITSTQLKEIYEGNMTTWQKLTNEKYAIHLIGLYPKTIMGKLFYRLVMMNSPLTEKLFNVTSDKEVEVILNADLRALGFCGFMELPVDTNIKLIKVDGAEPTLQNIRSGKYKLGEIYYACYAEKQQPEILKKMLEYFKTDEFKDILKEAGLIY